MSPGLWWQFAASLRKGNRATFAGDSGRTVNKARGSEIPWSVAEDAILGQCGPPVKLRGFHVAGVDDLGRDGLRPQGRRKVGRRPRAKRHWRQQECGRRGGCLARNEGRHELTHLPYKSWCKFCVMGAGDRRDTPGTLGGDCASGCPKRRLTTNSRRAKERSG